MDIITRNKVRKNSGAKIAFKVKERQQTCVAPKLNGRVIAPGKTLEQIRAEAVLRLRDIGLFL